MKHYFLCAFLLCAPIVFSQTQSDPFAVYSLKGLSRYPFRTSPIIVIEQAFTNEIQRAYTVSYRSMGLTISARMSVPAIPPENIKGMIIMLRGHQNANGYYTGKGTENPARTYLRRGWAVIAPDFLGYGSSSPAPDPEELHQFYSTVNAVELYLSLEKPEFRYAASVVPAKRSALPESFKKLVLWGHSNGGQAAIQTLETLGKPVPTVLWAPVSINFPGSMVNYRKNLSAWADTFRRRYPADDFALLSFLDKIAPGTPLLLEQGTKDRAVPQDWSDAFSRAVYAENARRKTLGIGAIAFRYEVYQNADHNLAPYWNTVLSGDADFWEQ